jgi:hypothetical protein
VGRPSDGGPQPAGASFGRAICALTAGPTSGWAWPVGRRVGVKDVVRGVSRARIDYLTLPSRQHLARSSSAEKEKLYLRNRKGQAGG